MMNLFLIISLFVFSTQARSNYTYRSFRRAENDNLSAVSDVTLENAIRVFPNPIANSFTIETSKNVNLQTLIIYNISGQLIDKVEDVSASRYVYEKQLRQGTYLLVIQTHDNKITHKKLVVL